MTNPSRLYFRLRDDGAMVFRVTHESRVEMEPLAVVKLAKREIRLQGDRQLSGAERTEIERWIETRHADLAARSSGEVQQLVEALNHTAHWAQTTAGDEDLEQVTDGLLLAMHDLRSVLVRRRANTRQND